MALTQKVLEFKALEHRKDGGRIQISTSGVDRSKDRVFPQGAKIEHFMANPVVLWGHDYYSAESLIGRAKALEVTETGIVADFELRPAANDADAQNVVLLLWEQAFVRAASIGFLPNWERMIPNEFGGYDFLDWELLEFSLVSVPANADALRLAAKSFPQALDAYQKRGARHSAKDQESIQSIHDAAAELGAACSASEDDGDGKMVRVRGVHYAPRFDAIEAALAGLAEQVKGLVPVLPTPKPTDDDDDARALLARLDHIKAAARR